MKKQKLDRAFVLEYSERYNKNEESKLERNLFSCVGPAVQRRGEYRKDEFLQVCAWKTSRTKSLVNSNSENLIEELTRIAFSCSEELRTSILKILRGVSTPTASALLTVWRPDLYTIVDYRVLSSLKQLSHSDLVKVSHESLSHSYVVYLTLMRKISIDLSCNLRSLDKALWMFDKTHKIS